MNTLFLLVYLLGMPIYFALIWAFVDHAKKQAKQAGRPISREVENRAIWLVIAHSFIWPHFVISVLISATTAYMHVILVVNYCGLPDEAVPQFAIENSEAHGKFGNVVAAVVCLALVYLSLA